jgi:hypothetical protein
MAENICRELKCGTARIVKECRYHGCCVIDQRIQWKATIEGNC